MAVNVLRGAMETAKLKVLLFMVYLFNYVVSSSGYAVSHDKRNGEY